MIAVIKGDIIASRKLSNADKWLLPLKELFTKWGNSPEQWEIVWGDFFQLEVFPAEDALEKAFAIKALIKQIEPKEVNRKISTIDVRMAIGIGGKEYSAQRISESNGSAFVHAGEKFERLKKDKTNLAIQAPWKDFENEINLYLKLAGTFIDSWTVSSAEIVSIVLQNPEATQKDIGKLLGIKQSAVSSRLNRAKMDELMEINQAFRSKIKNLMG